jgi:hypothetical protein
MFRFSQMGWYKSLSSNNASNNPQSPPTTTATTGDNFTATSVVNGGAPDYIFNKDQQRIILNPIDADNNNNSNIEQTPPKKMTMLHQMGTRLGLFKKGGGEQRIKTVIVSQPMITMSQSSLAYDQLDDDETATTSSTATRQQAKTKSQRASLNDTVQKNKLKLKNIVASSDESDKEDILADNDEDSSVHNQDRIYLDLSPKVVANTRP